MSITEFGGTRIVYRLRGIPADVGNLEEVCALLEECFPDLTSADVEAKSLATSLEYWERPPSKVATLQLKKVPQALVTQTPAKSWDLSGSSPHGRLVLDHQFLGLTPLNDVHEDEHIADCVCLSGLGSHPFGSWQPHGSQKSFMWIRDEAPVFAPGVRMILYGHDSGILQSHSFQVISDIARDFIEHLRIGGWSYTAAKPLLFLAHSLGGLILKDVLIQIADARNNLDRNIIAKIRGAIMFGVPNLGMEQAHLLAMVEGQPNETLIQDLARNSNYLLRLDESFSETAFLSKVTIFWAYELLQSHTVVPRMDSQGWNRNGPLAVLVSVHSATCRLNTHNPSMTFPIKSTHSDMVKFERGQDYTKIVCFKLLSIAHNDAPNIAELVSSKHNSSRRVARDTNATEAAISDMLSVETIVKSLDAPDLNSRQTFIESNFETTFEWIFEHEGFVNWLSQDRGLFWINGKPGSGKSTLMKFILKHKRTKEILHDWKSDSQYTLAGFFFHHRGSMMQKSFEGLLRSLLQQILWQHSDLSRYLKPFFAISRAARRGLKQWSIPELEKALRDLLTQKEFPLKLCLFFDALDEFYGHPELIGRFLRDLIDIQSKSRSSVKICVSSRPWDVFVKLFSHFPKFSLQDSTHTDIRDYCVGMIAQADAPTNYLEVLVPDIVQRASGVFLWVSLVVKDLSNAIMDSDRMTEKLEQLKAILYALPLELDVYYQRIVQRMASSHRWETYVLLELVIRTSSSMSNPSLDYVFEAISVSHCHTHAEASKILNTLESENAKNTTNDDAKSAKVARGGLLRKLGNKVDSTSNGKETEQSKKILLWGGGLVEVKNDSVQVMHQTVFEFVTSLKFKELVLGKLAKITHENGHVFHMKYLFATASQERQFDPAYIADHARRAEATTGVSHIRYINSVPQGIFALVPHSGPGTLFPDSRLSFAAWSSLALFLKDVKEKSPETWRDSLQEPLIEMCIAGASQFPTSDVRVVTRVLLEQGYDPRQGNVLGDILSSLRLVDAQDQDKESMWLEVCMLLLEYGYPVDNKISRLSARGYDSWILPLHIVPFQVAEKLLSLGADPNAIDSFGYTPLDTCLDLSLGYALKRFRTHSTPRVLPLKEIFNLACLLVRNGGEPLKTTTARSLGTLTKFETGLFLEAQDPGLASLKETVLRVEREG